MKNLTLIIVLIITNVLFAQTDSTQSKDEFRTLFSNNNGKTKVSGFGSFIIDFGNIENDFGLMVGGEGAVLFNQHIFVGMYGRGLATLPDYEFDNSSFGKVVNIERRAFMGHGGLLIGSNFMPKKPIHFGVNLRIGGGTVGLIYYYENYHYDPDFYFPEEQYEMIFAIAPEVFLEMNLASWFKVKLSAGYQYISEVTVDAPIYKDGKFVYDESGQIITEEVFSTSNYKTPLVSVGFIFGWFK